MKKVKKIIIAVCILILCVVISIVTYLMVLSNFYHLKCERQNGSILEIEYISFDMLQNATIITQNTGLTYSNEEVAKLEYENELKDGKNVKLDGNLVIYINQYASENDVDINEKKLTKIKEEYINSNFECKMVKK
jgi:hypothetical protein